MSVFENMRNGQSYNIQNPDYQKEVHSEIERSRHLSFLINQTAPNDKERIKELEAKLITGKLGSGSVFTPPFQVDCGNRMFIGKNVFANHGLTVMSLGAITIDDGVMMGPKVNN